MTTTTAHVVYRLYDVDDALIYIGMSSDFALRWEQHKRHSAFAARIDAYTLAYYATRAEAEHAERAAILAEAPPANGTTRIRRRMPPGPLPAPIGTTGRLQRFSIEIDRDLARALATDPAVRAALRFEARDGYRVVRTPQEFRDEH